MGTNVQKVLILLICFISLCLPNGWAAPALLKLMTFNIEYGGHHVSFDKVIEAIKIADPDVVAIQEAANYIDKIKKALGWNYSDKRLQLVSRLPLIDPPDGHGIYTFVEVAPGQVVALSNIHLPSDPYGPSKLKHRKTVKEVIALERRVRLPALERCLEVLPNLAENGIPTFLVGDFNSPSHLDWTKRAISLRSHMTAAVEWPVSKALIDAGFHDSYRDVHQDEVEEPGLTWWAQRPSIASWNPTEEDPHDRIDFIYSIGPARPIKSEIIGEPEASDIAMSVSPWPSDHRAVMSTFSVVPACPPTLIAVNQRLISIGGRLEITYHVPMYKKARIIIIPTVGKKWHLIASKTMNAQKSAYGKFSFDTRLWKPQKYEVLLIDEKGAELSRIPFWLKKRTAKTNVTLNKSLYAENEPIIATWKHGPGNSFDSVGIYEPAADPLVSTPFAFMYTNSTITGNHTFNVLDEKTKDFLPAGQYEMIYVVGDGFEALARTPFSVQ